MKPALSNEIAYKALQGFFQRKPFVLFGTGTSCAVDLSFGMPALQKHLSDTIAGIKLSPTQKAEWDSVMAALGAGKDFESAMDAVKEQGLLKLVVDLTARFIAVLDKPNSHKIIMGKLQWPAIAMINKLVAGLPETDRTLHVATPNYDLLAEHAFSVAGIPFVTGFWNGICRKLDWQQSEREVTYAEAVVSCRKPRTITKLKKHVRLYKVHGSLNVFLKDGELIENNVWVYDPPPGVDRVMITPGTSKFEQLHKNRYELLWEFDKAIQNHDTFLFLGYGFNDNQITNNSIVRKMKEQGCQGLIITRDLNLRIEKLLSECSDLWVVCKQDGAEKQGARVYNSKYANWLDFDARLWCLEVFSKDILGG